MQVIDTPEHSALTYVPRTPELALVTGVALVQGRHAGLKLDIAPFGDPELVPAEEVWLSDDGDALAFRAAGERYEVRSTARHDRLLFAAAVDLASRDRPLRHDGRDRIEVLFEQGRLDSLHVGRYEEGDPDEYVTVVFRDAGMFLVRAAPHERVRLRSLVISDRVIVAETGSGQLRYEVDAEPFLLDLLASLVSLGPDR